MANSPEARIQIRRATRLLLGVAAVYLAGLGLNHAWEMTDLGASLRFASPVRASLEMLGMTALISAPMVLALRLGRSAGRIWTIGIAGLVLAYGAAVVHPASHLLLGIEDYLRNGAITATDRARSRSGA